MKHLFNKFHGVISKNVPNLIEQLNSFAKESKIIKLKQSLKIKFPQDFKDAYLTHNGEKRYEGGMFEGEERLSLNSILKEWTIWKDLLDSNQSEQDEQEWSSVPKKGMKNNWGNKKWIPFN